MNAEFKKYYDELKQAYESKALYFTRNSDRMHNAAIMLLMLEKGKNIYMYCGAMSIFKNNFYLPDFSTDCTDDRPDAEIKAKISEAFKSFVSKEGNHIDIIVEKDYDGIKDGLIFDKELLERQTVALYGVPDYIKNRGEIGHYSFIDNSEITRIETDAESHKALCKIGMSDELESPLGSFEKLRDLSKRIR